MRSPVVLLFIAAAVACRGDVTAADSEDALAQDASLELQILQAQGDTAPVIGEVDASIDLRPVPVENKASTRRAQPPPAPAARAIRPAAPVRPPQPRIAVDTRPRRTTLTAAAGTTISFSAGNRICVNTSRVGDRFSARVNRSVRAPGGTVIPAGSRATGVVTGLTGSLGEEDLRVDIRSVTVGGVSRSLDASVVDIQLDRRAGSERCIPDGGTIEARLTSPLRVSSGNF